MAQALRPYPQYLDITNNTNPNGNSTYNALQAKIEKRLSHGFTRIVAYAWAKSLSDSDIRPAADPAARTSIIAAWRRPSSTTCRRSSCWRTPMNCRSARQALLNTTHRQPRLSAAGSWPIFSSTRGKPVQLTANNGLPIFNGTLRPNVVAGSR